MTTTVYIKTCYNNIYKYIFFETSQFPDILKNGIAKRMLNWFINFINLCMCL